MPRVRQRRTGEKGARGATWQRARVPVSAGASRPRIPLLRSGGEQPPGYRPQRQCTERQRTARMGPGRGVDPVGPSPAHAYHTRRRAARQCAGCVRQRPQR